MRLLITMSANLESELNEKLNAPSMEDQKAKYGRDIEKTANDRMIVMREVAVRAFIFSSDSSSRISPPPQKIVRRLEIEQQEMVKTSLEACQVESDSDHLDAKSEDMMAEINEALAAFNDANNKFQSAKQVSKEKLTESRDKLEAATEEVQGLFQTLQNVCDGLLDDLIFC
jgi:hypothetical protein